MKRLDPVDLPGDRPSRRTQAWLVLAAIQAWLTYPLIEQGVLCFSSTYTQPRNALLTSRPVLHLTAPIADRQWLLSRYPMPGLTASGLLAHFAG
jgi:hypothetical protein